MLLAVELLQTRWQSFLLAEPLDGGQQEKAIAVCIKNTTPRVHDSIDDHLRHDETDAVVPGPRLTNTHIIYLRKALCGRRMPKSESPLRSTRRAFEAEFARRRNGTSSWMLCTILHMLSCLTRGVSG